MWWLHKIQQATIKLHDYKIQQATIKLHDYNIHKIQQAIGQRKGT